MTKLSVWHANGQEVLEVGDDEDWRIEPFPEPYLIVGNVRDKAGAEVALHTQHGGYADVRPLKPRLHIFNLARVEVLK